MLNKNSRNVNKYFVYNSKMKKYTLKTVEEYYKENPNDLYDEDYKIPFDIKSLDDLIKIKRDSKNLMIIIVVTTGITHPQCQLVKIYTALFIF